MSQSFDVELNTIGLRCPLPLLKTRQTLASMSSGQVLHIISSDPSVKIDFLVFSEQTEHKLLANYEENGTLHFILRKG